jgi:endogenous inhibitor of DNA gyrase (YacG/DUF329 family)
MKKYRERIEAYNKNPRLCLQCNKPLGYGTKSRVRFCSHSCSAKHSNKGRARNHTPKPCKQCGNPVPGYRVFCSKQCAGAHKSESIIKQWLNGQHKGYVGKDSLCRTIQKYMKDRAGNKCEECGWARVHPITKVVPLNVHHIDGNKYNNHISNLKVLCLSCHSLTENFCGLNVKRL